MRVHFRQDRILHLTILFVSSDINANQVLHDRNILCPPVKMETTFFQDLTLVKPVINNKQLHFLKNKTSIKNETT